MNSRYHNSAYCAHCQRWISKTSLITNSSGAQMCPHCHGRVRVRRHPHDLPPPRDSRIQAETEAFLKIVDIAPEETRVATIIGSPYVPRSKEYFTITEKE